MLGVGCYSGMLGLLKCVTVVDGSNVDRCVLHCRDWMRLVLEVKTRKEEW